MTLDRVGIWTSELGYLPADTVRSAVGQLDGAGFAGLWAPESTWVDPFVLAALALSSSERLYFATGVARIHGRRAQTMVNAWSALSGWYPDRFVLGLGVSHQPSVEDQLHGTYQAPLATMRTYLDELDKAHYSGIETERRRVVLAALGPKMLVLASERTQGAHLYLAPVESTGYAREIVGGDSWLVPEIKVVFDRDPHTARALARRHISRPLQLPNYANNLGRIGFAPDEVTNVSDPVVDALVAWGGDDDVAARVRAHLDAGADQVAVQVLSADRGSLLDGWRRLASALT